MPSNSNPISDNAYSHRIRMRGIQKTNLKWNQKGEIEWKQQAILTWITRTGHLTIPILSIFWKEQSKEVSPNHP